METFKQYLTEKRQIAGWILPDGTTVSVPLFKHAEYVEANLDKFDLTADMLPGTNPTKMAALYGGVKFQIINRMATVYGKRSYIKANIEKLDRIFNRVGEVELVDVYVVGRQGETITKQDFELGEF